MIDLKKNKTLDYKTIRLINPSGNTSMVVILKEYGDNYLIDKKSATLLAEELLYLQAFWKENNGRIS